MFEKQCFELLQMSLLCFILQPSGRDFPQNEFLENNQVQRRLQFSRRMKKTADVGTLDEEDYAEDDVFISPAPSVHHHRPSNSKSWLSDQPQNTNVFVEPDSNQKNKNDETTLSDDGKVQNDALGPRFGRVYDETLNAYMDVNLPNQTDITSLHYTSRRRQDFLSRNLADSQPLLLNNKLPPLQAEHLASLKIPQKSLVGNMTKTFVDSALSQEQIHQNASELISRENLTKQNKLNPAKMEHQKTGSTGKLRTLSDMQSNSIRSNTYEQTMNSKKPAEYTNNQSEGQNEKQNAYEDNLKDVSIKSIL